MYIKKVDFIDYKKYVLQTPKICVTKKLHYFGCIITFKN